jgi:hypothetical protein
VVKCGEIDVKLTRYQLLSKGINDKPTLQSLGDLIAALNAEKRALHAESEKQDRA